MQSPIQSCRSDNSVWEITSNVYDVIMLIIVWQNNWVLLIGIIYVKGST